MLAHPSLCPDGEGANPRVCALFKAVVLLTGASWPGLAPSNDSYIHTHTLMWSDGL